MSMVSRPDLNWSGWDGNSASLSQKLFGWNTTMGVIFLRSTRNNNSLPARPSNFFRENNRLGDLADRLPLLPALLLQGQVSSLFIQVQLALQNALGAIHQLPDLQPISQQNTFAFQARHLQLRAHQKPNG